MTRSWRSSSRAAYEGYLVPFVVDENAVRYLTGFYDLDRDASRIALRDGQPAERGGTIDGRQHEMVFGSRADRYAQGRRSQYRGRPRSGCSNGAYACLGSVVVSSALAP
jgi:hypothetical protein